ncbi:NAD-dependent deacetylase [Hydrogenivirga caldilitoris]|uniref:NAD-dependent protein deacylase n=2 Tax=Hydrogenivirga caldilitoris TaxID=246264 RepID=A0A497XVD1_9AQUI|nr:NAD-dependent deacetylase [Hydrogenivirga caldilitoris]
MKIRVLTGAGISAESGIPTFRGKDGLWNKYDPAELATPEAFEQNPKLVWEWYDWRRQLIAKAQPNEGHRIVAKMEELFSDFWLITQNVDGLHQRAGSKKVIELHGNIWKVRCLNCGAEYYEYTTPLPEIPPKCRECSGLLRPGVVWFGESLPVDALSKAYELSQNADVFIVVGTSALVYPAAELPLIAKREGAKLIEVNPEETPITPYADYSLREKAGEGLRKVTEML